MIQIPKGIRKLLRTDRSIEAAALTAVASLESWLAQSEMPFFPGFTDHGVAHVNSVLETAFALATEESKAIMSSGDAAVLIIAVLLHDAGMRISEDTFRAMVGHTASTPFLADFDTDSWTRLWQAFESESTRFDQSQLHAIFGSSDPVSAADLSTTNISERGRLLIGEFLRRHHCRVAHEMAVIGIPQANGGTLSLITGHEDLADLAGLVARSHGMSLRATFPYLEQKFSLREYKGIRAVFLMGLLRIADYVQVDSGRANSVALSMRSLRSPISALEWDAHRAIKDVRLLHEDPEALFIDTLPPSAVLFDKLERLFADIQLELDSTWACFGEVFGRYEPLNCLALRIRRIRSSLDDPDRLLAEVNYIPPTAKLTTSGHEMLQLLVEPLYGDDVSFGFRELIQNAVDACKERIATFAGTDAAEGLTTIPEVKVEVLSLEGGKGVVRVVDSGIGMEEWTVRNCFLKAGSSFRNSATWRQRFTDEEGNVSLIRGGRFGVGALAAFLIADKIRVTTRHVSVSRDDALQFEVGLGSPDVEISRASAAVGTVIEIQVDCPDVWRRICPPRGWKGQDSIWPTWGPFQWYLMDTPSLSFTISDGEETEVYGVSAVIPAAECDLDEGWHRIEDADYDDIQWAYGPVAFSLCVNGILVCSHWDRGLRYLWSSDQSHVSIRRPTLSVFDSKSVFPLNLQRNALSMARLPFEQGLVESVSNSLAAELVARAEAWTRGHEGVSLDTGRAFGHRIEMMKSDRFATVIPLALTSLGVTLFEADVVVRIAPRVVWILPMIPNSPDFISSIPDDTLCLFTEVQRTDSHLLKMARVAIDTSYRTRWGPVVKRLEVRAGSIVAPSVKGIILRAPGSLKKSAAMKIREIVEVDGVTQFAFASTAVPAARLASLVASHPEMPWALSLDLDDSVCSGTSECPLATSWINLRSNGIVERL